LGTGGGTILARAYIDKRSGRGQVLGDPYFSRQAEDRMVRSTEHVTGQWRYARIEGASHWIQLDALSA
jgi:hypothetical protein